MKEKQKAHASQQTPKFIINTPKSKKKKQHTKKKKKKKKNLIY